MPRITKNGFTMTRDNMNDHMQWAGTGNILLTSVSIICLFIHKFFTNAMVIIGQITIGDIAGVAAILAALTTAVLNIYKFIQMRKGKKIE